MLNIFKNFANDESGAVTVDWVVLTAAVVALGFLVMNSVTTGVGTLADNISSEVGAISVTSGQ